MVDASAEPTRAMTTPGMSSSGRSFQGRSSERDGSPDATRPRVGPENPEVRLKMRESTTASSTPGNRGWIRRPPIMRTSAPRPSSAAVEFHDPGWARAQAAAPKIPPGACLTPSRAGTWVAMRTMAAAGVNPDRTGWDIR